MTLPYCLLSASDTDSVKLSEGEEIAGGETIEMPAAPAESDAETAAKNTQSVAASVLKTFMKQRQQKHEQQQQQPKKQQQKK